jgi:hypothetical protein
VSTTSASRPSLGSRRTSSNWREFWDEKENRQQTGASPSPAQGLRAAASDFESNENVNLPDTVWQIAPDPIRSAFRPCRRHPRCRPQQCCPDRILPILHKPCGESDPLIPPGPIAHMPCGQLPGNEEKPILHKPCGESTPSTLEVIQDMQAALANRAGQGFSPACSRQEPGQGRYPRPGCRRADSRPTAPPSSAPYRIAPSPAVPFLLPIPSRPPNMRVHLQSRKFHACQTQSRPRRTATPISASGPRFGPHLSPPMAACPPTSPAKRILSPLFG